MMNIKELHNDKKGVLRIVEAFIAVMLVLSAILIIVARQRAIETERQQEMITLEKNILDYISTDNELRSQILINNTDGVAAKIQTLAPSWINYSVRICPYLEVCPLGFSVSKEVYANEILVIANLTDSPAVPVKLKLFFWEK